MLVRILVLTWAAAAAGGAAVQAIRVIERTDVAGGKEFGTAGPYERIVAQAIFEVDPKVEANRIISDIDLAPRNEAGLVEFKADLHVLKPRDPARGNGTVFLEINNRGGKGMLGMFNRAPGSLDPKTAEELGDGLLLERGFTLVWVGWQGDVPDQPELMRLFAPVATENGKAIEGLARAEITVNARVMEHSLADRNHIPYPAIDPGEGGSRMTVRDRCDGERRLVERRSWEFTRGGRAVKLEGGFEPGKIYEVVYRTKDPVLVGLGPAAVRDVVSYLKYGTPSGAINILGDQRRFIKHAIGFGTSQSGRFLRTYLYYGFNADEKGRKVFDGIWAHVAGAGRGSFNHRFAQPSRNGHAHFNCAYPSDIFPFTDVSQTDPVSGWRGGLLDRSAASNVTPKVFYTNSSYEYWGRAAALTHVSVDGGRDMGLGAGSRSYLITGTQHGAGSFPPGRAAGARYDSNGNDYRWVMRGLLVKMEEWVREGKAPPESQIPLIAKGELVAPGAVRFPRIAGVSVPARPHRAWRADYGPGFPEKGIITKEPPDLNQAFPVLVPQVDADGNEIAGIKAPMVAVPLGTYTGWNLRSAEIGAAEELYSMVGSTFLFARTRAEREKTRDPRPSIAERYKGKEDYLARYREAAEGLQKAGFLLAGDVGRIIEQGAAAWDRVMAGR